MKILPRQLKVSEDGLVSIIVTMIFLIVLSLIVLGFAQIARREQRQALDRQLASQAFYAAESGINIARKAINTISDDYSSESDIPKDKTTCPPDTSGTSSLQPANYQLDGDNTKITCILIDQAPRQLDWSSIDPTKSTVTSIKAFDASKTPQKFNSVTIDWQNKNNVVGSLSGGKEFPIFSLWNNVAPVLRVELIPIPASGSVIKRDDLISKTITAFLRPSSSGVVSIDKNDASGTSKRGELVKVNCSDSVSNKKKCVLTINNLDSHEYILRMKTEYGSAAVSLTAQYSVSGTLEPARIGGAQAEIDATGKASDVLKRIRVKAPYNTKEFLYPEGVIDSGDSVCKRLEITPTPSSDSKNECDKTSIPPVSSSIDDNTIKSFGDSVFAACPTGVCYTSTNTIDYRWTFVFYNISVNEPNIVKSCTWNFGDGSPVKVGYPPSKTDACLKDQYVKHSFPLLESPLVCRKYTVTLTINFNNGYDPQPYSSVVYVPGGTEGKLKCNGKYKTYP